MEKYQQEAFKSVKEINDKLFEEYDKLNNLKSLPLLSITFSSNMTLISLSLPCENEEQIIQIYNSEYNDRKYYENSDKYETFNHYIKRKFKEIKQNLNNIKL